MNHIERLIISRFLRYRAEIYEKESSHEEASCLKVVAEEVESQKEGKPAFGKEHFEEFGEVKAKLSAKKFLDDKKKQSPLDSFRDILGV